MGAGDEGLPPPELPQGTPAASDVEDPKDTTNSLSIKVTNVGTKKGKDLLPTPPNSSGVNLLISTKSKKISSESASPHVDSPLISPASSAFASALQSPYISPRALAPPTPPPQQKNTPPLAHLPSPPVSYCGSQSDDIPSSSYTPPPERSDFSDDPTDEKPKFVACIPVQDHAAAPRISFSFQVPRISFARGSSVSPASNAKLRSCDVYIGYRGQNPNLVRFCKWLKSELELQGIACFVADRAKYADSQSHEIADRVICSVTFGLVVVTGSSFLNHLSMEEIRFFSQKKNLIPLFFDQRPTEVLGLLNQNSIDKDSKEAIDGLMKCHEFKLEVNECNWRHCISKAAAILTAKLGRKRVSKQEVEGNEELPFPRNAAFLGREKEITEIGTAFFGSADFLELDCATSNIRPASTSESEDRAVYAEHKKIMRGATYIDTEMGTCKEPNLEAWIEPAIERGSCKRQKYRKPKSANNRSFGSSIVCISGVSGVGKTELALEFAYRNLQRYKMVLWVGSEARYFRQNILNLSSCLGLDVTADTEKERRIRSFDEQEFEAFKRVKREMFCDMPYLIILDNLETEKEWWDGKDLHDLIPRNTGGSHVIITTRLSKVPNYDIMQLLPLPMTDAMILLRGRRKKDYPAEEMEYLTKFDEKLKRSTFGLSVIGSLLSEFAIPPSSLFEAVNQTILDEGSSDCSSLSISDEQFCRNNPFLMKTMTFCTAFLQQSSERRNHLASRMLLVGAWFAPAPISVNLLATAAKNMAGTGNRLKKWAKCLRFKVCCTSGCNFGAQSWNSEEDDSTHLLVKLGMARRANRQPGCWIQLHSITQILAKRNEGFAAAEATVHAIRKVGNPLDTPDHLWTSAFLVFGFKSEPPLVQLKAIDMVLFIKRIALPLALKAFATFSMCNSALELLKVCTNVLDEVEKSFVSQIQDWYDGSLCWKKKLQSNKRVDEYVWQEVTLLKATLLETRAQLLLRGGHFDSGEELCRTCISIRTVMLGYNHAQTLAAQETLAKLVRSRSKI